MVMHFKPGARLARQMIRDWREQFTGRNEEKTNYG